VIVTLKSLDRTSRPAARAPRHAAPARGSEPAAYAGLLVFVIILVPLHRWWAAQVLLVPILLVVPGIILLRALRVPGRVVSSFPIYVPCASIAVLLGSGLAVGLIGRLLGAEAPIRTVPLLAGLEITCLALLATSIRAPADVSISWSPLTSHIRLLWPLIVPLAAAAGALRLNSGHDDALALAALSACAVMVVASIIISSRLSTVLLAIIVYATQLATAWAFSLRGDLVYGFDISTEYYDLNRTILTGTWQTAHPGDAYGAMLSVTVMPAELHFISGVPALLVLKLVYPAISALLPVGLFGIARRILSTRWAYVAACSIVMQGSFAQELPAIARQEIALLLFVALIMAMIDSRMPQRSRVAMVSLLSLAMVLSHYSTTYVAILLIGLTLLFQWLVSWFRNIAHVTGTIALAFIVSCMGAVVWYGPVTHAAAGVGQLVQTVETNGFNLLPNRTLGHSSFAAYLQGNSQAPIPAADYARRVSAQYVSNSHFITPLLPDAGKKVYALHDSAPPVPPIKWRAGHSILSLGALIVQQLIYLISAIGAIAMVLRRRASRLARHIGLLAISAILFLITIRLSGTLAETYNQERALLQAMVVLAIPLCWCLQRLAHRAQRWQACVLSVAAASLAVLFIGTSGLLGTIFGGSTTTNLASSGEDFERFYMTTPELASAQWLGQTVRPGQLVYADRYAQLPLIAMTGITRGLYNDVTPLTINQHAWIYANRSNVIDGRARALFDNQNTVIYTFSADFLNANYDLVYSDGSSEVFHR
jgi:uncharacterized membrane protein